jgi:hypothetical protein
MPTIGSRRSGYRATFLKDWAIMARFFKVAFPATICAVDIVEVGNLTAIIVSERLLGRWRTLGFQLKVGSALKRQSLCHGRDRSISHPRCTAVP